MGQAFRYSPETAFYICKPLNTELNPICHLLALLRAHHIHHIGRIKVNQQIYISLSEICLTMHH
jgi:hypothetical protein